jgi:hypothetical protein
METTLTEDYIKHLAEQRVHFYKKGRFDIVEKINKQIKETQWLQHLTK